jgi:hypothetical protein
MLLLASGADPLLVPTWIGAIAAVLAAAVAGFALIPAAIQVRQNSKQIAAAAIREAQDSEDRTRPYVGMDVVPSIAGGGSFDLVIENFGRTTARNILISLENSDFGAQSQDDSVGPALARVFAEPFDLAPGARRRLFWHLPDDPNAQPRGVKGAPAADTVIATYQWQPGNDREGQHYEERYPYDLTDWPTIIPRPFTGAQAQGSSDDTNKHLRNIAHGVRAVAHHAGEQHR